MIKFNHYPWQVDQWQHLTNSFFNNTLSHAYLLKGRSGMGKLQFAKAFSSYLLCKNKQQHQPCHECKDCKLFHANNHPDLIIIQPEKTGKQIKVDDIRNLMSFVYQSSQQGGIRVIIINQAETMNKHAANALLKALEEPKEKTVFLLITEYINSLLPTVRSRCQQLAFEMTNKKTAQNWLQYASNANKTTIESALSLTNNSPLKAQQFIENNILEEINSWSSALKDLLKGKKTASELVIAWQKTSPILLLDILIEWLEDAIKIALTNKNNPHIRHKNLTNILNYISTKSSAKQLLLIRDELIIQRTALRKGTSLNAILVLESALNHYLSLIV